MVNGAPTGFLRVLNVVPRENSEGPLRDFLRAKPQGEFQYSPEGLHEYSRDLPRGSIQHDSPRVSHRFSFL